MCGNNETKPEALPKSETQRITNTFIEWVLGMVTLYVLLVFL